MNEKDAREMLDRLFERHKVPEIPIIFYPKPKSTKKNVITPLGIEYTLKTITKGTFNQNMVTGECWIGFYGLPSERDVRHEFKHYLDHLGIKYIKMRRFYSLEPDGVKVIKK